MLRILARLNPLTERILINSAVQNISTPCTNTRINVCHQLFRNVATEAIVFHRREAVNPGDSVKIGFSSRADVTVNCGDHEAVEVKVAAPEEHAADDASSVEFIRNSNAEQTCLEFLEKPSAEARSRHRLNNSLASCRVLVKLPPRFVSLDISSAGGDVFVESIKEASVTVQSGGGNITVLSVKGNQVILRSQGGSIKGAVTAAKAELLSKGGAVHLKSIVGQRVQVESWGGPVIVGAGYLEEAIIKSGGAPITLGTLQCQDGNICSDGGNVSVDGLQGSAQVFSGGGAIQVHVQPNSHKIQLSSSGGPVVIFLSPGQPATVQLPEGTTAAISQEMKHAMFGSTIEVFPGSDEKLSSRLQACVQSSSPNPAVQVNSGAGRVEVKQRSWFEAMTRKIDVQKTD